MVSVCATLVIILYEKTSLVLCWSLSVSFKLSLGCTFLSRANELLIILGDALFTVSWIVSIKTQDFYYLATQNTQAVLKEDLTGLMSMLILL